MIVYIILYICFSAAAFDIQGHSKLEPTMDATDTLIDVDSQEVDFEEPPPERDSLGFHVISPTPPSFQHFGHSWEPNLGTRTLAAPVTPRTKWSNMFCFEISLGVCLLC